MATLSRARNAFIALMAVGWWWALRRPFRIAVEGESMSPTLEPGDLLLATSSGSMDRGSLIVVEHPDRPGYEMVKRLAALPGDPVGGRAIVEGERWVVGDNSEMSTDSRHFGPVHEGAIRGVVRLRYWPPSRWTLFV